MYIAKPFVVDDLSLVKEIVSGYPFAQLILKDCVDEQGLPWISHLPFNIEAGADSLVLYGHMAKANQMSQVEANLAKLIFNGPEGYISPDWYQSELVPTWNYIAIEMTGQLSWVTANEEIESLLKQSSDDFETKFNAESAWNFHIPIAKKPMMLNSIIGFRITIDSIQACFKLSQNRSQEDFDSLIKALNNKPLKKWMLRLAERN